jgi:hypothetical protein
MPYVNRSWENTSEIIKEPEIPKKKEIPTAVENSVENWGQNGAPNATEAENISEFNRNGEMTTSSIEKPDGLSFKMNGGINCGILEC